MNKTDEMLYETAAREVALKKPVPGVYAKAFADADGDGDKTIARYIRLRVEQLRSEMHEEADRRTDAERERTRRETEAKAARRDALGTAIHPCSAHEETTIARLRPDMKECIRAAAHHSDLDKRRFMELSKWYRKKSDSWIYNKLQDVTGTFRAAYGLLVLEAFRRDLDIQTIRTAMAPDELPEN